MGGQVYPEADRAACFFFSGGGIVSEGDGQAVAGLALQDGHPSIAIGWRFGKAVFFLGDEVEAVSGWEEGNSFFGVGAAESFFPERAAVWGKVAEPDIFLAAILGMV